MTIHAYPIKMEISGNTAMFTRPDSGDCPVSYPAPTYSAVKAIFESILWGPAVMVIPTKVEICTPVQYHSYHTNYGGPLRKTDAIRRGVNYQMLSTVLIDVCYKLHAVAVINSAKKSYPEHARHWDAKTTSPGHAYQAIFNRRLKNGQCYSIPVLGQKDFSPSYFGALRPETHVPENMPTIEIPSMLRQVFSKGYNSPVRYAYDQNIVIENGVLLYPERGIQYAE